MALSLKKDVMKAIREAELLANNGKFKEIDTNRFVEAFYECKISDLVRVINSYSENNNLKIISVSVGENLKGAIVLFEGNQPQYKW